MNEDPNSTVAILEALARALPPEAIDELWIFPPRRIGGAQSTVVVASAFEQPPGPATAALGHEDTALAGSLPRPPGPDDVAPQPSPAGAPSVEDEDVPSDRRRILTAHFTLAKNQQHQAELRHELAEHGAAPAERVGRVVDGVFRRLDDEPEPPRHARIGGERDRWIELLASLSQEPGAE